MAQEKDHRYASVPQEEEQVPQSPSPPPPPYHPADEDIFAKGPTFKHKFLIVVAAFISIIGIAKILHLRPSCRLPGHHLLSPRPPISPFAPDVPAAPVQPEAPAAPVRPAAPEPMEDTPKFPPVFLPPVVPGMVWGEEAAVSSKVPLEAHIMSKCPDAKDCLRDLIVPAMEKISDKVDFKLSFIGSVDDDDDGVQCMHGAEECFGNIIELCAAHLYPDPKISLGFTMCMTENYGEIPQKELVKECALEHSVDFDDLNDCVSKDDGEFGMGLLRKSVVRSADAGVEKSCTVRLDDKIRCVRDGGEWKDCTGGHKVDDLVDDIEQLSVIFTALGSVEPQQ